MSWYVSQMMVSSCSSISIRGRPFVVQITARFTNQPFVDSSVERSRTTPIVFRGSWETAEYQTLISHRAELSDRDAIIAGVRPPTAHRGSRRAARDGAGLRAANGVRVFTKSQFCLSFGAVLRRPPVRTSVNAPPSLKPWRSISTLPLRIACAASPSPSRTPYTPRSQTITEPAP